MKEKKEFFIRPYVSTDIQYVAEAHERIYREEFGWSKEFTHFAQQVVYDFADSMPRPFAQMWIAEVDHKPVGSIMLQKTDEWEGQLRLFLMEKEMRKQGIGTALLALAMETAKEWELNHLFLWTAEPLTDARRKYAALGFSVTDKVLMGDWALDGTPVYEERWDIDIYCNQKN